MAVIPLGAIMGALTVTRLVPLPTPRRRLLRPLAVAILLVLLARPSSACRAGVALLAGLCASPSAPWSRSPTASSCRLSPTVTGRGRSGWSKAFRNCSRARAALVTGALAPRHPGAGCGRAVEPGRVAAMLVLTLASAGALHVFSTRLPRPPRSTPVPAPPTPPGTPSARIGRRRPVDTGSSADSSAPQQRDSARQRRTLPGRGNLGPGLAEGSLT